MFNIGDRVVVKTGTKIIKTCLWDEEMDKYVGNEYVICGITTKHSDPLYKLESCTSNEIENEDEYWLFQEDWLEKPFKLRITEDEIMKVFNV